MNCTQPVALITGAASGLGWALAEQLCQKNYALVLVDLNSELLQAREKSLQGKTRVLCVSMDITQAADIETLVEQTQNKMGRLDCLINNAGITHRSLAEHTQPAVIRKVMAVDYQAPVEIALACLPLLQQSRGKIINISSMAGWMPVLGRAGYCAAKSALHQFFETLRCEVRGDGVSVLMVYPSFLDTPIEQNALGFDGKPATHARSMIGNMRSPDWMAGKIIDAMDKNLERLFPDKFTWFASLLYKLAPGFFLKRMSQKFASELNHKKSLIAQP
ncbi:SDR family oxidoreductase [Simiduia curdlanivorans]|uniref:SDR family oxidoreductase n=1 Tax=Simiduia curdlanivorans TaxID=1492769 RepID=A0ABV8V777_9GAMM|nr:SDR family oxidoreductase [Simiduia curdlanivorans]MDN3639099.1 SDR family oxidoreductase [Simiduia curdlanivorans]